MILLFQILFCAFALFAIAGVYRRKKEGLLGVRGVIFWTCFWMLAAVVVFWPDSASTVATTFGIGRGADLIIYTAVAVLFYLVFKLHIKLESISRDVTKIVRHNALHNSRQQEHK